jgi:subtilisin family serine protease
MHETMRFESDSEPGTRQGVRIHSNSWGSPSPSYTMDAMEADLFMHAHPDFLIVVAVGNDGEKGSQTLFSPATAKNVLSVGASQLSMQAYVNKGLLPVHILKTVYPF